MLQLRELTRTFRGMDHPAVNALDLEIATGEVVALAGASGSGKTTTLRLIAGFDRPDDGYIAVHQQTVAGPDRFVPPERRSVGVVFQDFALFPHLTVAKNVAFGISELKGRAQRRRVEELLELAGIPELSRRYPHEISGGQQQRVALARALAPRPDVILLDEPFSNLDHTCTHRLLAETRQLLKAGGSTAIVVTHDRYEAFTLADRIAVLEEGRLEQCGTAEEIYAQPATRHVAEFAGSASFLPVWHSAAKTEWTCPLGPVPDDVAVVPAQGGGHLAVVRPHQLTVTCGPCSFGEHNASILDVRFLGAVLAVRLNVTWESGFEEVLIHVNGPLDGLTAGSPARVDWVPRPTAATPGQRPLHHESSVAR
ncbi:MAG: ABC transporter ATP-binding protein [Alkalispirochaeta sp.]